jgi:hypothetical protein
MSEIDVMDGARSRQRVPRMIVANESHQGAVDMQIATIGLDIAKNVFQVHGIDAAEKVVVRKQPISKTHSGGRSPCGVEAGAPFPTSTCALGR